MQQPSLPAYRVPVFEALAKRLQSPGDGNRSHVVRVLHGRAAGSPPSVTARGFDAQHVPVHQCNTPFGPLWWHSAQWRAVDRQRADVAVLVWNTRFLSLAPALLRARLCRMPVVLWGHGYSRREGRWRRWLRNTIARLADAVMVYNHTAAQRLIEDGHDPERIFIALNSLDQMPIESARHHWLARPQELSDFRRRHDLSPGRTVLFTSRLQPRNRLDLLLHATSQLAADMPGLKVVIVGEGEPERARLRAMAKGLGIADRIMFTGAIYDETALAPWFLCSDVFCYPANIGLSVLHAFGYGVPVVTGDNVDSHNPEIEALSAGENGLYFRHGDADSLAAVLRTMLNDEPLRRRMGQAALRTVRERYTLDRMVQGFVAAVDYAIARRGPRTIRS